jgi:hypothetical protein
LYRKLGERPDDNLTPLEHNRHQLIAKYLYDANGMCKRMINLNADYVVGEGWEVRSENKELLNLFDSFWKHPVNNLVLNLHSFVKEFAIFGEQVWKMFTNEQTGLCEIGYFEPTVIDKVVQTSNPLLVDYLEYGSNPVKVLVGVKWNSMPGSIENSDPVMSVESGDTFFMKGNSFLSTPRGRSDLIGIFELSDLYSQFIYSRCDRSLLSNNIIHDFTIEGGTDTECDEFAKAHAPMRPNQMMVHNERVKYKVESPNMRAQDAHFDDTTVKNFILGSQGFPDFFYGSGGDTNRATAMEMHEPVIRMLKTRQNIFRCMLNFVLEYVRFQARARGRLTNEAAAAKFWIEVPEISYRDMQRSGLTMMYLAQSLAIAIENEWISGKQAAELYAAVASGFGPNIEPNPNAPDKPEKKEPGPPPQPGTTLKVAKGTGGTQ